MVRHIQKIVYIYIYTFIYLACAQAAKGATTPIDLDADTLELKDALRVQPPLNLLIHITWKWSCEGLLWQPNEHGMVGKPECQQDP